MTSLFGVNPKQVDENFRILRDDPQYEGERLFLQKLWGRYDDSGCSDKNFSEKIARGFHPRFWEMYLTCTLIEAGLNPLPKKKQKGPDIRVLEQDTVIWVEATAPGPGEKEKKDTVPPPKNGIPAKIPEDNIIFRFTHALDKKFKEYKKYLSDDTADVSADEPYVIAINGGEIPYSSIADDGIPRIVKAVFSIGNYAKTINIDTSETISEGLEHRSERLKRSGYPVFTNFFLDENHKGISGLLFSNVSILNTPEKPGDDFILIHNPLATNRISDGWLKMGREYWYLLESNELIEKIW